MAPREPFMGARASPIFRLPFVASADDVDALGHISNIAYVRWVQNVAGTHSEAVGYDLAAYRQVGSVFVVRRHEITYLQPALAGDAIELVTWIESWRGASSPRKTQIIRQRDGAELARCVTLWALVNEQTGRPTRTPAAMREAFAKEPRALDPLPIP